LPLLPSWRCHHRSAGVIVDVLLAPLGHHHHHGTGVVIDVALALLPLLLSRRWRHCGPALGSPLPA
jgi:hypothetical protein